MKSTSKKSVRNVIFGDRSRMDSQDETAPGDMVARAKALPSTSNSIPMLSLLDFDSIEPLSVSSLVSDSEDSSSCSSASDDDDSINDLFKVSSELLADNSIVDFLDEWVRCDH